jgi:molybdopterin biosynthesis enzyme
MTWQVTLVPWQGSGDPFGLARANGLLVRPVEAPSVRAGSAVPVIPLDPWG